MRRVLGFLLMLVVLAVATGGCNPTPVIGGKPAPFIYQRGVSLSPGVTEFVTLVRSQMKLAGRTQSCNYPAGVRGLPVVMSGAKPDYEKIASLAPEMVVYDADLFTEQDIAKFKELNIETFGFSEPTVTGFCKELYVFATKVGGEIKYSEYVDQIQASSDRAKGAAPTTWKPKVAVVLGGSGAEHWVAGTDSFLADVVRLSGGEVLGPKASKFSAMNAESFLAANPDVIIVAGDPTEVANDPRLKSVNAVKKGNVAGIKEDILLRKGARVNKLIDNISAIITSAHQ